MRAVRRRALQGAYRRLLTAAMSAEEHGVNSSSSDVASGEASLVMYVRQRVRQEVEATRTAALATGLGKMQLSRRVFERRLEAMEDYACALDEVAEVPEVAAAARCLSLGVGSVDFRRRVEEGLVSGTRFHYERHERGVADEDATERHQNRVMVAALLPFAEKLAVLHSSGVTDGEALDAPRMANAMAAKRSTTRSFFIDLSVRYPEALHADVDDELGKQTVYIRAPAFDPDRPTQRVETCELSTVRRSSAHVEYASMAERYLEVLEAETPVHRSRATVIVGHGVGGAVAVCLALLMRSRGYGVRNVVTIGAPRAVSRLDEEDDVGINCVRLSIDGDGRVGTPTTDDDDHPFFHVGEGLHLVPSSSAAAPTHIPDDAPGKLDGGPNDRFGVWRYIEAMSEPDADVAYAPFGAEENAAAWEQPLRGYDPDTQLHASGEVAPDVDDDDGEGGSGRKDAARGASYHPFSDGPGRASHV